MAKLDTSMFFTEDNTATRKHSEKDHEFRTHFQRDRDRVLFSKAFRRLKGKTQVFLSGYDDHIRNRLTHTLEVSQIATTICSRLSLNFMLTEAIALGHDLGHTPFGHVGERALNEIMNGLVFEDEGHGFVIDHEAKGFKHNWQSLRVVDQLENAYRDYPGLNLTQYALWGILHHSSLNYKNDTCINFYFKEYPEYFPWDNWSFEALIVNFADEIAQRHHDFEDGVVAGLIDKNELIEQFQNIYKCYFKDVGAKYAFDQYSQEKHRSYYVPLLRKCVIDFYSRMTVKVIERLMAVLVKTFKVNKSNFRDKRKEIAAELGEKKVSILDLDAYSREFFEKDKAFQGFLKDRVLNSYQAQQMDGRSNYIIRRLFSAYLTNPQQLSDTAILLIFLRYKGWNLRNVLVEDKSRASIIGEIRNELQALLSHH